MYTLRAIWLHHWT